MADTFRHIQTIKPDDAPFATRPDYGSPGTVNLWANYFEMIFKNPRLVFHLYTISLEPFTTDHQSLSQEDRAAPKGKKLMQIIRCALDTSTFTDIKSEIATDFSNTLISCRKLEDRHLRTGRFPFWAENDIDDNEKPKPRSNAIRWQMSLEPNTQLHISDLLTRSKSGPQKTGSIETVAQIIQALDTVLYHRNKLSLKSVTPKQGKCFPVKPDNDSQFGLGYLKFVRGFFASVRSTADRPLLNCNACYGAFYNAGNLVELFDAVLPPHWERSFQDHKRLELAIQGLRVELNHLDDKPVRTVFGLARRNDRYAGPGKALVFDEDDQVDITVVQYWEKKNYDVIKNQTLPVVNVGDKRHPFHVPAQVCQVLPGQMAKKKLESTEMEAMMKFARRNPEQTRAAINKDAFSVLGFQQNFTRQSFGIDLNTNMKTVNSRVLARPTIVYHRDVQIDYKSRWNMMNQRVIKSGRMVKYGIMSITSDGRLNSLFDRSFEAFRTTLCKTLGVEVDKIDFKTWPAIRKGDDNALKKVFEQCQTHDIGLLVVVLPDKDASLYRTVKRLGDTEYGIDTICVVGSGRKFYNLPPNASYNLPPNASYNVPPNASYHANVALKINLKLGGQNHKLAGDKQKLEEQNKFYKNTMVIGIDVTHPSPGPTKRTAPSVAAMAASIDGELSQWLVDLRINVAGQEMVELIGPMLKTRLEVWQRKSKLPNNLLIYRDGVSESQYEAVLREELAAILNTCKTMYIGTPLPKITLIVVGKRHHTRFFQTRGGTSENPEFETVVDSGVTEARNWDFYLQSHHALVGTARPAHYFVLLNQIFDKELVGKGTRISDYLHQLTYELCYLFGRSTGPVSIPPPVYYAHLACERSRCYGDFDDVISDTSSTLGDDGGNPGNSRGVTQLPLRGHGSGSQVEKDKPVPSNQRSADKTKDAPKKEKDKPVPSNQGSASKTENAPEKDLLSAASKLPDVSGLSKKQKARLYEERQEASRKRQLEAASQGAADEGSSKAEEKKSESKAEGKKNESKAEAKKPETKGEAKKTETKAEGKKLQGKPEEEMLEPQAEQESDAKAQGKKSKSKAEGKKPDTKAEAKKTETKAQGTRPQAKPKEESLELQAEYGGSSKAQGKKPQNKAEGKKPEAKAQEEEPQTKAQGKQPESKAVGKNPESKAEGKKQESKAEGKKPEPRAEGKRPQPSPYEEMFDARVEALLTKEEKNIVKIHDRLKDTMFFV